MSWLSRDKTGRPKEQGGHHRRNVSFDVHTIDVLYSVENHSIFIEQCINDFIQPKWQIHETQQTVVNSNSKRFADAYVFELSPQIGSGNAIMRTDCGFSSFCENGGIAYRVTVNGIRGLTLKREEGNSYTCSYSSSNDWGFLDMPTMFHNCGRYTFCLQFRPLHHDVKAYTKDVHFAVKFMENPLLKYWDGNDNIRKFLSEIGK